LGIAIRRRRLPSASARDQPAGGATHQFRRRATLISGAGARTFVRMSAGLSSRGGCVIDDLNL
jgi:hypothetical protein